MQLVERAELLAELDAWLAEARLGSGSVVLLGGEAGVGKSSVARAFVEQQAPSWRVLWGSCEPLVPPEALGPFHDMLPMAAVLAAHPGRVALLRALLAELETTPTVMVAEDAHWADDATLDALRFIGRRVQTTHALLLVTFREEEATVGSPLHSLLGDLATTSGSHRVHVPALSVKAVAELAEGHAVEAGRLHAVTGGNPFYVTEVLAAAGWTVPPTVADAVLARASRLGPAVRAVLEVVSLAPGGLEPAIVVEVSGGGGDILDTCVEHGMLVMGPERVTFRHELARLAVEGSVPASRRQRLHGRILEQLELADGVEAARLTHHADAAADAPAVLRYAPLAAHEASRRGAHRAAAAHLARAVDHAGSSSPGALADLVSAWADERTTFDDPFAVLALRQRVIDLRRRQGDLLGEGSELIAVGRLSRRFGSDAAAYRLASSAVNAAIDILERLPPGPELASAYAIAANDSYMAGQPDNAMRRVQDAMNLAESTGARTAMILALRTVGSVEMARGRKVEALEAYDNARRLAIESGDHELEVAVLTDTGTDLLAVRRHIEAESRFEEAVELGVALDLDYYVSYAELCLGWIAYERGRWAEAERRVDHVLSGQQESVPRLWALAIRGRIQVRRGSPDALMTLSQAGAILDASDPHGAYDVAVGRAEAAWLSGRPDAIAPLIGHFRDLLAALGYSWVAGEIDFWMWRAGALSAPPSETPEPFALHMAGNWRAAAAAWDEIGCPYEQAEALSEGDEPAMRQALEIFSRLGAVPAADRLRERMRRAGISNVPARPHRSNRGSPAQLTPRQLEILGLVELGLTNGEIGARLFITEKTAGHHVSAILGKLGARSRTEAASTARKMGIVASET
jgi:DNA-binding CsgD family transcriptional regulator/tetratricopeptide (TPR) repeat protein